MALQIPLEIRNSGYVAAYWRLTHYQVDLVAGAVEFQLHGYPDHEARTAGKQPLPVIRFRATARQLGLDDLHQAFGRLPAGPSQMHARRLRQWTTFPPGDTEEDLPSPTYLTLCKDM